ncbi:SDR family oxidoreductase [Vibrio sp. SCSIO 43136]|uniref:SDR family NAD(P)-dependent oxidoreductase n=1 Tax=Vibrio sp. SCSIO 43136 TaxID=2819101 RepID=UPI0020763B90|nr:SDR family oxidoreductase [Vibrio sp. SCSIO 43136]USD67571.1 SDR family oxidoreductase [Vibrio sp. SCSIO 43136]
MFDLTGKVAVITGAASGIGKCTAERFTKAGAKVVVADINVEQGEATAKELGGLFVKADVTKEVEIQALMETAKREFGQMDILVNCAGILGWSSPMNEVDADKHDLTMALNVKSVVLAMKHAANNINQGGAIVNLASIGGMIGMPTYMDYVTSKHAVVGATKVAALELADMGVSVNAICPSTVDTPMAYAEGGEAELAMSKVIWPKRRMAKPEEIAALAHFLVADDCKYLTGQALCVDGGYQAGIGLPVMETILGEEA